MNTNFRKCIAVATLAALTSGASMVYGSPMMAAFAHANPAEVTTGVIQDKCLARWHDSFQVHSVRTIIRWNYQATKTTMKKLEHCVRIKVVGPLNIEGMAKSYVQQCVDYGLNHDKTRYILQGISAVVGDVYGGGGSLTSATVADYAKSVADHTIDCLTDTDRIAGFFANKLQDKFNATISRESHWVYWDL